MTCVPLAYFGSERACWSFIIRVAGHPLDERLPLGDVDIDANWCRMRQDRDKDANGGG
jgi:hypothetical protein